MSLLTIEGTYKDGNIELTEQPDGLGGETTVLVTFLARHASGASATAGSHQGREALRQQAFARMEAGLHLGGSPYPRREDLHDRFDE
jgi:hypothetical protein